MALRYNSAEMKIISLNEDILTISAAGTNEEPDWGNLDFGGEKNSPLADLANTIADKL